MPCIDTDLAIDFIRGNRAAERKIEEVEGEIYLSTPSMMELWAGTVLSDRPEREKEKVLEFLTTVTTLDLDRMSSLKAGQIYGELEKEGKRIQTEDIQIAAIAITNEQKLITNNERHFSRINGLEIETY